MDKFVNFLNNDGFALLSTILLGLITYFGARLGKWYERKVNNAEKRKIVKTCVKAVEQLYYALSGPEKLEKAKSNIVQILNSKGIEISELELDMLIEEVVSEFNFDRLWGNSIENKDSLSEVIDDDFK